MSDDTPDSHQRESNANDRTSPTARPGETSETRATTDGDIAGDSDRTVVGVDATDGVDATSDGVDPRSDVAVPDGAEAHECAYCGRRVPSADLLDLHRGLAHPDALDEDEVAAFRAAYDAEGEAVNRFRIVALGALVALYFGFLFVYVVVT